MDQKNSPDARHALYLNQSEGLLNDPLRFPLVLSSRPVPTAKPYLPRDSAPVAAAEQETPGRQAVKRWVDAWRARWSTHPVPAPNTR